MQHRMKDMLQTIRDAVTNGTIVECQGNLTLVCITRVMAVLLMTACTLAQTTDDPFSTPIAAGKMYRWLAQLETSFENELFA